MRTLGLAVVLAIGTFDLSTGAARAANGLPEQVGAEASLGKTGRRLCAAARRAWRLGREGGTLRHVLRGLGAAERAAGACA